MAIEWRNKWRTKAEVMSKYTPGFKIVVFDVETTGLSESSKIIQFSAIKYHVQDDYSLQEMERFNQYINPMEKIPDKITEITGISDKDVEDKPNEFQVSEQVIGFLNSADVISGYNVSFDIEQIMKMSQRTGVRFRKIPVLDVCEMARDCVRKSDITQHKLGNVVQFLFPESDFTFHDSMEDVKATANVLECLVKEYLSLQCEEGKSPAHLEKAKLFINPRQKSMQRICLKLSIGNEGDIFYDIPGHFWSCKTSTAAKKLFNQIDMCDLEHQFYKKYVYPFNHKSVDDVAKSWLKFSREKRKEAN